MDEKIKELIALGASISGHCQPCLTYHVDQAKRLGIGKDEIREAVAVGKMVQKGAMSAMNKFVQGILDSPDDSVVESPQEGENRSKTLKVYDPAMCCATGVCGTNVDSALVEFTGALKTAAGHGIAVERWNLAQQPQAFAQNPQVKDLLTKLGIGSLPFIFVHDELKLSGRYPTAKELFAWLGIRKEETSEKNPVQTNSTNKPFPILERDDETQGAGGCCADGGCCS
jgi:AhpD family alkylhydroperoxidase